MRHDERFFVQPPDLIVLSFLLFLWVCAESTIGDATLSFKQAEYSLILAGLAVVLSDGRAAFLTSENSKFEPRVTKHDLLSCSYN